MKRRFAVLLVALGLAGSLAAVSLPSAQAASSTEIYLAPKVNQPGTTTEPSSDAKAVGSALLDTGGTVTAWMVQQRQPGGAWENKPGLKTRANASMQWVYFEGWSCCEYRIKWTLLNNTTYSDPIAYTWTTLAVDEFADGDWDDQWNIRPVTNYGENLIIPGCETPDPDPRRSGYICDKQSPDYGATTSVGAAGDPSVVESDVLTMQIKDPTPGSYTATEDLWGTSLALDDPVQTGDEQQSFTDFWAAARMKVRKPEGAHESFWMNNRCNEIDVFEYFPRNRDYPERNGLPDDEADDRINTSVYWNEGRCDGYGPNNDSMIKIENPGHPTSISDVYPGEEWYDKWHVYSIRWLSGNSYQIYVDDQKVYTYTGVAVSSQPLNVLLSFVSKGEEHDGNQTPDDSTKLCTDGGPCGEPELDPADLPLKSKVDWVRVWDN